MVCGPEVCCYAIEDMCSVLRVFRDNGEHPFIEDAMYIAPKCKEIAIGVDVSYKTVPISAHPIPTIPLPFFLRDEVSSFSREREVANATAASRLRFGRGKGERCVSPILRDTVVRKHPVVEVGNNWVLA